jgi:hypothetical protein
VFRLLGHEPVAHRWSQVCDRAEDDGERLDAAVNLAASLSE